MSRAVEKRAAYQRFLEAKVAVAPSCGFDVDDAEINPILKPHQRAIVRWMVAGGRRACFASFGLGKTIIQLEAVRLTRQRTGGRALIGLPLGVRQEFRRDAVDRLRWPAAPIFIRSIEEAEDPEGIYLTNYETVRDGKLDPADFSVVSFDEADALRSFGSKTFGQVVIGAWSRVPFRYVASATPDPNDYLELLGYAQFLGVMDIGQAKTRFFKRDSEHADKLTLHAHKEAEFWLWVASWALVIQRPSDLGFSDEGYALPPIEVRWHEVPTNHAKAGAEKSGQARMFKSVAQGVTVAAREKRDSLPSRLAKLLELRAEDPGAHRILWHDLEDERRAIEAAIPDVVAVYGTQDLDDRERAVLAFSDGEIAELASKPVLLGAGCNFQRHCAWSIFLGIGYKFRDLIQAVHRIHRFLQGRPVRIDLIYTEAERAVRMELEAKWERYRKQTERLSQLIRGLGLAEISTASTLTRSIGVERREASGKTYCLANNDAVLETMDMETDSVDLILTSPPFSTQYQYTPSYNDFGHTDSAEHFWKQMDFLTPELLRVLRPGRVAAVHVKDRVVDSGMTGLGFQVVHPFHADAIFHFQRHGFAFLGMKTIVTDVVRENKQTYRLGYSEQCKDGSRMGAGLPEYLLLFRKPQTDRTRGYADVPVVKLKDEYSRARWQFDAHGFSRSSGDRLLTPDEISALPWKTVYRLFREYSSTRVYDFERDVALGEALERKKRLPPDFMLLQPVSWHPDVWTDVMRMRSLNGAQAAKGREKHLCLARGSLVLTRERGYAPIQDVLVGEQVLTHLGRWRPVLAVQATGVRAAVTVRAHGVPGLTLTPDHRVWARTSTWSRSRDGAERAAPVWLEASETRGGYVNLKLPPVEPAAVDDPLLWWTVGRWLADGHWGVRGDAYLSCGTHERDDLLRCLGRFAGMAHRTGTAVQIRLRDRGGRLRDVLRGCGRGADRKRLPPDALVMPQELAAELLDGYLSGDGHFVASRGRWMVTSVGRDLVMGLALLVQRVHGAIASVYAGRPAREATIQGRRVRCKREWVFSFDVPGAARRSQPFVFDDGAWKKVRSVAAAGDVETWNLRVDEDESYTAEGVIVKNCPLPFDIVDRAIVQFSQKGEVVYDPFGGLGTVAVRAVKLRRRGRAVELNPRYFADGAAYCEAAEREIDMPSLFVLTPVDRAEDELDVEATP